MAHRPLTPDPALVRPTNGQYAHGLLAAPARRMLFVSGQVPVRPDGSVPSGVAEQTVVTWENALAVLAAGGMAFADVARLTHYIVGRENLAAYNAARLPLMGDHRPASTLVLVAGLARPEYLVEVEMTAVQG